MFEKDADEYAEKTSSLAIKKFNPLEPKLLSIGFQDGAEFGYNKASEWYYVTDKLPPNPKESGDGISIQPLNYICAYECGDNGCGGINYECDEFMYMGNGEWLGENKKYPIYAWLEHSVEVPKPRKE